MERYTLNLTGAIYGWEVSPKQVGRRRLSHATPIRGLYLSGHWTQPGGGVYGVVASGLETARAVAGDEVLADFVGTPPSA
jgi:prolycopene isomerase